eukprot:783598-Rhodomonas_salina.1
MRAVLKCKQIPAGRNCAAARAVSCSHMCQCPQLGKNVKCVRASVQEMAHESHPVPTWGKLYLLWTTETAAENEERGERLVGWGQWSQWL